MIKDHFYFVRMNATWGFCPCSFDEFIHFLNVYNPRKVHCKKNKKGFCIYQSWFCGDVLVAFCVYPFLS